MTDADLLVRLLAHVQQPGYRPQKPRLIARHLGLEGPEIDELKRLIKRAVKSGTLVFGAKHQVLPRPAPPPATPPSPAAPKKRPRAAQAEHEPSAEDAPPLRQKQRDPQTKPGRGPQSGATATGVFRRRNDGGGTVRLSASAALAEGDTEIAIAAAQTADASTGDQVLVRLLPGRTTDRRRLPRGAVVEILARQTRQFVGTYYEEQGQAFVAIDGGVFSQPIAVGDPGAKNAQPDDKVVCELLRFPTPVAPGEGVLIEVLGPRGTPGIDTLSVIREFGLGDEFPPDVQEAARHEAARFREGDVAGRDDLTRETIITIDPLDARDFDDAISLTQDEVGHFHLGVHIADVAHFVRLHSALDREARERATSVYLPDRVLPMLPELISNGLASLQPERVRYTLSVFREYTAEGVPIASTWARTAIRSVRRFAYEEVDDYLARPEDWRNRLAPEVHVLLARMHELALLLRARRQRRGALQLDMPEVKIKLDADGRVSGAEAVVNTVSHQIIEEFMLAANEAVAEKLHAAEVETLRRVHAQPDPRRLKALTEFVAGLGLPSESLEDRFALQRLLTEVSGRPEQPAVHYAVLRSLAQAVYSPELEGHYALASQHYCHFTSPIRRYPDLVVHRAVHALLARKRPEGDHTALVGLGEHCSQRERRAESAERELTRIKLLEYLSEHVGTELEAVITGVESYGLFVRGVELPAEGLIHVGSLPEDFYSYDRRAHLLQGRRAGNQFRLGDPVRVAVARVDVDRRELDFRLVRRERRPPRTPPPGRQRRAAEKSAPGKTKRRPKPTKQKRRKR